MHTSVRHFIPCVRRIRSLPRSDAMSIGVAPSRCRRRGGGYPEGAYAHLASDQLRDTVRTSKHPTSGTTVPSDHAPIGLWASGRFERRSKDSGSTTPRVPSIFERRERGAPTFMLAYRPLRGLARGGRTSKPGHPGVDPDHRSSISTSETIRLSKNPFEKPRPATSAGCSGTSSNHDPIGGAGFENASKTRLMNFLAKH